MPDLTNVADSHAHLSRTMSEQGLQDAIIELGHLLNWRIAHFRAARTKDGGWKTPVAADGQGFPDLVLCRTRVVVAELKREGQSLTAHQEKWVRAFRAAGIATFVWKPSSWLDGTIERELRRMA